VSEYSLTARLKKYWPFREAGGS